MCIGRVEVLLNVYQPLAIDFPAFVILIPTTVNMAATIDMMAPAKKAV